MNRTQRLVAAVTSSLLLTAVHPAASKALQPQAQNAPQEDESWKTDPKVREAADTILPWLDTSPEGAKSKDEIAKNVVQYRSELVAKAMKFLLWQNEIKRTGEGTQASPFRYYARASSGG